MSASETLVVETAARVLADLADPQTIVQKRDDTWKAPLWSSLREIGLDLAWVSETAGGAEASLADGFGIIRQAGRAALAAPLAETLLAGWLLDRAGLTAPGGPMTVAPVRPKDHLMLDETGRINGRARMVPFAGDVDHIVALATADDGLAVALVRTADCTLKPGKSLAGDARDTVEFANVLPVQCARLKGARGREKDVLLLMGAAARAQQIAGALDRTLELSVLYSQQRIAFEKPISKFQAIQHSLARLGGEVAAAASAAASAADTIANTGFDDDAALLEIAAAKIRCSEAAEVGAGIAHQVHGAIGFTDEHILHRFTLRLLSWRDEFGDETFWSLKLGEFITARGPRELWPLLASR
ncbi:acyl-CoA/acyl-ACP dehydrogenase [Bradyrhizobium sp. 179]|uniref:acyl-CoA dehydrogenase family protein n=1 Tax=Bradyrhizobium sp. 179 TaxID=2782648 RepID=UPI001FFA9BF2|nr:acyl-CoA dehydrogenase family protein [Bradyrhizobium sp. 179]MCK1546365.1 acyl-CoA/acyl-ACP dehydrogenase [Bradyrhizobium sp. 179]